ncbi:probable RNA-binding protein 19 [Diachasma alloeum]|uniref:probable RNA-binding protein 19 n=1 Tax=Diachasma alloeum TaxID=454923 RepID=UPI0007381657|nr:probable RNA-binding protein 19 [Diachasma alloeum]
MSRLIVKNLPPSVTETKLKDIFSEKGIVTDVQLKYTKDGKFRRFGFVGFKTEEQAQAALNFFHKTCIDTARITVELCAGLGDASKPKAWSKYAQDSTAHKKLTKSEEKPQKPEENPPKQEKKAKQNDEIKSLIEKHKEDPLFVEFMETHGADGSKIWGNDTEISAIDSQKPQDPSEDENSEDEAEDSEDSNDDSEEESPKIADKKLSDLEYMESLKKKSEDSTPKPKDSVKSSDHGSTKFYTVKLKGLGYNHKKKHIKQFFHPLKAKSIRVPQKIKGIAYVGFASEKQRNQALNKDKSFLEGKRIFITKYEGDKKTEVNGLNSNDGKAEPKWKKQEEALKDEEAIAESGRMFVRNLSYSTTEDDLRAVFEKYGQITEVNLPVDKVTRKLKGFGTVTFMMPEHAAKAYSELDGSILNGRMLHLLPGKSKPSITDLLQTPGLTFKEKKELERKATAGSSHNWNTLFLGQNTVVQAIASTYNTTKDKVLEDGGKGTSVAVRLALGETQLVEETRKFLEENGVRLDAFNQAPENRSKTIILVKNLPPGTKAHELREKFKVHGEVGRVVMPPSGVTALVEFLEPSEARKAFTRLAYTKFKHIPLYLEWAPDNSLTPSDKREKNGKASGTNEVKEERIEQDTTSKEASQKENKDEDEDDEEPEPDTTLFVKNLNFSTDEETLKKYFSKCGRLHYASVTTKKDPNNPGQKLSMGYGFVRYKFKSDADRALKELQSTTLDGKTLELKRSERTLNSDVSTTKKTSKVGEQTGTKILIKNIPFQANADEITELFKAFGELKAVRLPKKLMGQEKHRGFGFVEYYTKSDSKRAFKALCQSTHLYGRRLVLEWAQTIEDVDDIRKRTAKHFHQEPSSKRSKKATLDPESVGLAAE